MMMRKSREMVRESRLLFPFKCVGTITAPIPFCLNTLGSQTFATVSTGKAFQVLKCGRLSLAISSPPMNHRIRALAVSREITFVASKNVVTVWKRCTRVGCLEGHSAPVTHLLTVGNILFSVGKDKKLCVWEFKVVSRETEDLEGVGWEERGEDDSAFALRSDLLNTIQLDELFEVTCIEHPPSYLNKIILGSADGRLALFNVRSGKLIYEFKGWSGTAVSCLAVGPVVDIAAVGLGDGRIILHNLRFDRTVSVFSQVEGAVTSIAFRVYSALDKLPGSATDSMPPLLATGAPNGTVSFWNLEKKCLHSQIPNAHWDSIVKLSFLPNKSFLLTAGADNAVKLWMFESSGGVGVPPRMQIQRTGHTAPPLCIRYYGGGTLASMADGATAMSCHILSAGGDRTLRDFNTAREQQSMEISQGHLLKKAKKMNVSPESLRLPPVVSMAAVDTTLRDWSNLITAHNTELAYVWSFENRSLGKFTLQRPEKIISSFAGGSAGKSRSFYRDSLEGARYKATSCDVSRCGNWGIVGYSDGSVHVFNMQSGRHRGSFPRQSEASGVSLLMSSECVGPSLLFADVRFFSSDRQQDPPHDGAVSALALDAFNKYLVSAGVDGTLRFWDFKFHKLIHSHSLGSSVRRMCLHKDNGLLAVALDDATVVVFDITVEKGRRIRRFVGHTNQILDMCFSPDGSWLCTVALDSCLRVWDLPTAACIDWVRFKHPATSVTFSPTSEFIATAHVDTVPIYLWGNRSRFSTVVQSAPPSEPVLIDFPTVGAAVQDEAEEMEEMDVEEPEDAAALVEPLSGGQITLTSLPMQRWADLPRLDDIKARNKPIEPPKAPVKAPFFLPTAGGLDLRFVKPADAKNGEEEDDDDEALASRILSSRTGLTHSTVLSNLLREAAPASSVMDHCTQLSPSALDAELRSLCLGEYDAQGVALLDRLLTALAAQLTAGAGFEAVQAIMAVLLEQHRTALTGCPALAAALRKLQEKQSQVWKRLDGLLQETACLTAFLCGVHE